MRISTDEFGDILYLEGEELASSDGGTFEVLASKIADARLAEIPRGFRVRLCDRVIGSRKERHHRNSACTFERNRAGERGGHGETAFFVLEDDEAPDAIGEYLRKAVANGRMGLEELKSAGRVTHIDEAVYDDIAYLTYSVRL